jgi:hypothetical protein
MDDIGCVKILFVVGCVRKRIQKFQPQPGKQQEPHHRQQGHLFTWKQSFHRTSLEVGVQLMTAYEHKEDGVSNLALAIYHDPSAISADRFANDKVGCGNTVSHEHTKKR